MIKYLAKNHGNYIYIYFATQNNKKNIKNHKGQLQVQIT